MAKFLRQIIVIVCVIGLAVVIAYYILIYSLGRNFVHDRPASDEYYQSIANRIYFTTKYRGDKFDTLLSVFLKSNPVYSLPDSINPQFMGDSSCDCDCLPLKQYVYFAKSPMEIYYLTYDHDTMYATGSGVIDIIFSFNNNEWSCTKTSTLDSVEKARIENRLDTAVLQKLN